MVKPLCFVEVRVPSAVGKTFGDLDAVAARRGIDVTGRFPFNRLFSNEHSAWIYQQWQPVEMNGERDGQGDRAECAEKPARPPVGTLVCHRAEGWTGKVVGYDQAGNIAVELDEPGARAAGAPVSVGRPDSWAERFVSTGTPVTPFQREVIEITAEECGEVAQRAMKACRFGLDETQAGQPFTNATRLARELGNLLYMVDYLCAHELVDKFDVTAGYTEKARKLPRFLQNAPPEVPARGSPWSHLFRAMHS